MFREAGHPPPHKRFARRDENYLVGEPVKRAPTHATENEHTPRNATMDEKYEALLLVCLAFEPLTCRPSCAKHSVSCARV